MSIYTEFKESALSIRSELAKDLAFSRDEYGGVILDVSDIDLKVRESSEKFRGNAKRYLEIMADVVKKASDERGHSQVRIIDDTGFRNITVSIRGGFPSVPNSSVSFERLQEIMNQRCGLDLTFSRDKMHLTCITGFWEKPKRHVNTYGEISQKNPQNVRNDGFPDENEIKSLEDELTELEKLSIASDLLSIVQREVRRVVDS